MYKFVFFLCPTFFKTFLFIFNCKKKQKNKVDYKYGLGLWASLYLRHISISLHMCLNVYEKDFNGNSTCTPLMQNVKLTGNKTSHTHDSVISSQHKAASMMSIYRGFYHCHDNNLKQSYFSCCFLTKG